VLLALVPVPMLPSEVVHLLWLVFPGSGYSCSYSYTSCNCGFCPGHLSWPREPAVHRAGHNRVEGHGLPRLGAASSAVADSRVADSREDVHSKDLVQAADHSSRKVDIQEVDIREVHAYAEEAARRVHRSPAVVSHSSPVVAGAGSQEEVVLA